MDGLDDRAGTAGGVSGSPESPPGLQPREGAFSRGPQPSVVPPELLAMRGLFAVLVGGGSGGGAGVLVGAVGEDEDLSGEAGLDDGRGAGRGQVVGAAGCRAGGPQRCASGPALTCTSCRACAHTWASIMSEAGEAVVALVRWLGHSSPAITLGYYAHFMPEAGSKGRGTIDGLLGERGGSAAGRHSPDSPQRRRPAIPALYAPKGPPLIVRLKRWVAWESAKRGCSDPLCHASA